MWQIFFYEDRRGKSAVEEYLKGLPAKERAKIRSYLLLLEEFGIKLEMPYARYLGNKLWELRPDDHRLLYFTFTDKRFWILHAFRKKTQKTPEKEIQIAMRRMAELLSKLEK